MARNTSVNVGVNFVPDTTQLDSALKQFNNVDLQTKVTGISGDVLAPFRQSVEDLNAAMASGRGENEIAQLMDRVKTEANAARASLDAATAGIKAFYDSPVNQDNLKAIAEIDAKLESATNQLKQWNKNKSALNELRKLASDNNFDINTTARGRMKQIKDIEALRDAQGNLNEEFQTQIDLIRRYQTISNELRTTRKGDIESNIRNLTLSREGLLANTITPETLTNFTTSAAMTGSQVTSQENDILNRIPSYTQNLQKMAKASDEARGRVKELGDTFTASFLGFSLSNILEDAVRGAQQFFTAYDDTLTRTQMVTGMTRDEVMNLTSAYAELADELSSTISAVAEAQLVFYQQGLSTEDSLAMTEASIAISKTGGIEAGEAADRLTAAVNGYQLAASDAMDIADKMSALDAAAASSVNELTVAMQKSASQARMAGLDLDYYMAYLSTMQEVTREAPENIGTAMKSITSRIQEITDIGKVEEDGTTFSNVAEALNSIGIAALDTQGQLRPLQEILNELGPMWANLDRNHQAYIATVLAGNRQQSRFIALMDNYDRALELVDISQNSTGESARQLRAYDEGLESSLIGLQNAWQQFATSLVDSDMIKTLVDALTSLIEVINAIPDGLLQIVAGFAAASAAYKTFRAIKSPNFGSWFNNTGLGQFISALRNVQTENQKTTAEITNQWQAAMNNIMIRVSNAFSRIGSTINGLGNNSQALARYKQQIDGMTTSVQNNTAAKQQNNATYNSEVAQIGETTAQENALSTAYLAGARAINENKNALDGNDISYVYEQDQILNALAAKRSDLEDRREQLRNEITGVQAYAGQAIDKIEKKLAQKTSASALRQASVASWAAEGVMDPTSNQRDRRAFEIGEQLSKEAAKDREDILANSNETVRLIKQELDAIDSALELNKKSDVERREDIRKTGTYVDRVTGEKRLISGASPNSDKYVPRSGLQEIFAKWSQGNISNTKNINLSNIFSAFGSKNLSNLQKFGTGLGEISKGLNGVSILSSIAAGSIAQMIGSLIGLPDDLNEGIGRTTSLMSMGNSIFPGWGLAIGAAIGIGITAFDMLTVSAEEAREKLEEINAEQDELTQRNSNIENALSSYTELSNNLERTEEEQQQLNDAAAQLADLIPEAVSGYDNLGNAIIDVTRAQAELNSIAEDNVRLAKEEMQSIADLQEAEDGWDFTRDLLEIFTPGGKSADEKQLEDRLAVAEEYQADITDYFTTLRDSISSEMDETEAQLFNNIASGFQNMITERVYTSNEDRNLGVEEAAEEYERLLDTFTDNINISDLQEVVNELSYTFEYGNQTFGEAADKARERLTGMLQAAGYDAEEIEQIIRVVLDISVDGGGELYTLLDNIEAERNKILETPEEERTDSQNARLDDLHILEDELYNLSDAEREVLSSAGYLDPSLVDHVMEVYGSYSDLADLLLDVDGNTNKYTNSLKIQENTLKEIEALEQKRAKALERINNNQFSFGENFDWTKFASENRGDKGLWGWNFIPGASDKDIGNIIKRASKEIGVNASEAEFTAWGEEQFYTSDKIKDAYEAYKLLKEETEEFDIVQSVNETIGALEDTLDFFSYSPEAPGFADMASDIDSAVDSMSRLNQVLEDLEENEGRLSAENVSSIFTLMNDLQKRAGDGLIDAQLWSTNMAAIADSFQVVNGQMTMSETGREALLALQEESIRATYREQVAKIEEAQAELMTQKQILEAQRVALQNALTSIETQGKEEYNAAETKGQLESEVTSYLRDQQFLQVKDTAATLNEQLAMYSDFFSQLKTMWTTQDYSWEDIVADEKSSIYESLMEPFEERWDSLITDDYDETVNNMKNEIDNLTTSIDYLNDSWNALEAEKTVAEFLASEDTDLSAFLGGAEEATDAVDEYNEQLERTLTLLEKIEGIQHKIDENDAFRDLYEGYNGARRGELLGENLRLYEEQFDYYKQLFDMQQEMTNQAAGDLLDSMYGDMFTIAENGDIGWATTEMYDKYKGLPDDMQEDIDNLVQAFQEQRDALRDTENELLNYAEAIKDAREEIVELIEETEDLILQTIQDREEVLHEARIKALEDEIEMIEEAVEARNDAREEQDNAEDLFNAQEALRRATLDSSGKNNATLLQLQQDLEDKQQEISEKRFEDDMDARKEYLQAIIDAENETYEYRLETMTWYWEQVELMQQQSTERIMNFLMTWNKEYLTESQFGQEELMREWQSTFEELNAVMQDQMTDNINDLKNQFLDLASGVEAIDVNVQALAGSWEKVYENASKANGVSSSGGGGGPSYSGGGDGGLRYYTEYTGSKGQAINKDALTDGRVDESKVFTSTKDNYGTYYMPNNVGGSPVHKTGVTAGDMNLVNNSSKVGIKKQAVWKSDAGEYYVWNGSKGKYETLRSLYGQYGNPSGFWSVMTSKNPSSTLIKNPTSSQIRDQLKALGASRYAFGGLVDYTGPAWVDGSTTNPEAFLSAYQTEQIGALAKALDSSSVSSVSNSSNVTFGAITFNVASMSSAADGRKALDTFVKGANEMMAKKGVNTTLNLNYK